MYTYEEKCIINLGDCYTLQYGYIVKQLMENFSERGEKASREGIRRFGVDRATTTRNKHLAVEAKINMLNLFTLFHDLPGDPRFRRELQELNPQERVSHTLVCPMADTWRAHGQMHIGRIYCEEFHPACYSAYAYGYTQVNLAKTLTQEDDEYCAFNVVLRPENLPEELRPICFEEYDPHWTAHDYPAEKINGKNGFNTLSIKLYFYLLQVAWEQLGGEGVLAVESGLRDFAGVAIQMLRKSGTEENREIDETFVNDNIPVHINTVSDPIWEQYNDYRARERMQKHFCNVLQQEFALGTVK
jgi:hypothetical protein